MTKNRKFRRRPLPEIPTINLRLASAYCCNRVCPDYEDRFLWASQYADELVAEIGARARTLLTTLAQCSPDKRIDTTVAAGPLENYVNLVVEERSQEEAARIRNDTSVGPLLKYVWGDVKKLKPLAKNADPTEPFENIDIGKDLQVLPLKDLMGFWCWTCTSKVIDDYNKPYQKIMRGICDEETRDAAIHDLMLSAPDERAAEYLKENIIIMRDW